jgi:formylglycine-generating enzyme
VTVGNVPDATARVKDPSWTWAISRRDGYVHTAPVRQFRPNAFGLSDVHGNVAEWCADWFDAEYYTRSLELDPRGGLKAAMRVVRGGSWPSGPQSCRSAARTTCSPGFVVGDLGFRLAGAQSAR